MRIKTQFVLSHMLAALVPLAIMALIAFLVVEQQQRMALYSRLFSSSSAAEARVETLVSKHLAPLIIAFDRVRGGNAPVIQSELSRLIASAPSFEKIVLIGSDDQVKWANATLPQSEISSFTAFTNKARALPSRTVVTLADANSDALALRFAVADKNGNVLLADLPFKVVLDAVSEITLMEQAQDARHKIVMAFADSPLAYAVGETHPLQNIHISNNDVKIAHTEPLHIEMEGQPFLATAVPLSLREASQQFALTIYAVAHEDDIRSSVQSLRYKALALAICSIILIALLGFSLADQCIDPLRSMSALFRRLANGETHLDISGVARNDEVGEMARALHLFKDNILELSKLSRVVEQSPASVIITDPEGNIEYVNSRFMETTGYQFHEVIGRNPRMLKSGYTDVKQYKSMWDTLMEGKQWQGEFHNRRKDGSLFWESATISALRDASGKISHFVAVKADITAHKTYAEELLRQATYDRLTDLPNRALASEKLSIALQEANRTHHHVAVIIVDINRLRIINDTLGLDAGDELLRQAAGRLTGCLRAEDMVARMGGDEFLIILSDITSPMDIEAHAAKISECFNLPFLIDGRDLTLGASLGIAVYPSDGRDMPSLLKSADAALHLAKEAGRNTRRYFTPEMHAEISGRLAIEAGLRTAIENNELHLVYHPLIDCATGRASAAEALIRWKSPDLGNVPPDVFIPIAEEAGLIVAIGEWVIRTVCRDMMLWDKMGLPKLRIAVNVSMCQLRDRRLLDVISESLQINNLEATRLEIELTERVLLARDDATGVLMRDMKDMGLRLSIDDFGTGYSAMSYLTSFPFDVLKIDRSFVQLVNANDQDAALARAIITMAHSLGMEVVAEGVELKEQVDFMSKNGCEILQGYYFSHPLPFEQFSKLDIVLPIETKLATAC